MGESDQPRAKRAGKKDIQRRGEMKNGGKTVIETGIRKDKFELPIIEIGVNSDETNGM